MKPLAKAEQETILRKYADEKEWDISTTDSVMMRRLRKLPKTLRKNWKDDPQWGVWVTLPEELVIIRTTRRRPMTEEQKQKLRERFAQRRQSNG